MDHVIMHCPLDTAKRNRTTDTIEVEYVTFCTPFNKRQLHLSILLHPNHTTPQTRHNVCTAERQRCLMQQKSHRLISLNIHALPYIIMVILQLREKSLYNVKLATSCLSADPECDTSPETNKTVSWRVLPSHVATICLFPDSLRHSYITSDLEYTSHQRLSKNQTLNNMK